MTGRESRRKKKVPPFPISVHDSRKHIMCVGAGTDEQEEDEKKGLKVEDCSLSYRWMCKLAYLLLVALSSNFQDR